MEEPEVGSEASFELSAGAWATVVVLLVGAVGDLLRALGFEEPLRKLVSVTMQQPYGLEHRDPLVAMLEPWVMALGCVGWLAIAGWVVSHRRWPALALAPLLAGLARLGFLVYVLTLPLHLDTWPAWAVVWLAGLRGTNVATIAALGLAAWVMVSRPRPTLASAIVRIVVPAVFVTCGASVVGQADAGALVSLAFLVVQGLATAAALYAAGH